MKFAPFARRPASPLAVTSASEPVQDHGGTATTTDTLPPAIAAADGRVPSSFEDRNATEFGCVEAFDGSYLAGWYFELASNVRHLSVIFDGKVLCGTLANLSRMDVVEADARAPEKCGFFVDLKQYALLDRCADNDDLRGRLKVMSASGTSLGLCFEDPFLMRAQLSELNSYMSNFDSVDGGTVKGWAVAPNATSVEIHVAVDGILQGTAKTKYVRQDVADLTGSANAGFVFALPARFQDGRRHSVTCTFADTGEPLVGSPKDVLLMSTFEEGSARASVLVDGFLRLQREVESLREQIKSSAMVGVSYFANYTLYQDLVSTSKTTLARLRRKDLDADAPLFSIVMPTYKTDPVVLEKAIDSVVAQTDRHWELVISDSASNDSLRNYLRTRAADDERIRVIFNDGRLGISDNTNVALQAARGEYIGFMDHDDELTPEAISLNRQAFETGLYDLVYSDEDKLDYDGNRVEPHYKSAYDPDLLLCMNYICHLVFVRRSTLFETELNRRAYDGAQDWDLLLQLSRRIKRDRVGHIPRVLYHWRMIPGSTAVAIGEKSYAVDAGLNAVKDHLAALGASAEAARLGSGLPYVDVRWQVTSNDKISVIIPTKDRIDLVVNCVNSVLSGAGDIDLEVLIVDNNSAPTSTRAFETMCADPRVKVIRFDGAFNYSAINNFAARQATGRFLLLLNNDVFFTRKDWLTAMLGNAQRPEIGAVGLKLLYPNNTIQHCGVVIGNGGVAGHAFTALPLESVGYFARTHCTHEVSGVTAACLLVRADIFWQVGGLDEEHLTVAFNDVDLCMKIQAAGYRNILVASTYGYHAESISRGYEDTLEKIARFEGETATMRARWGKTLTADRFYSPNLDLNHACYTVLDLSAIVEQEAVMVKGGIVR